MADIKIRADTFFQRIERLQTHLQEHKSSTWGGADSITATLGTADNDSVYSKTASLHLYLFGYEFPDSIIVITKGHFYFFATAKKCSYLQKDLLPSQAGQATQLHFLEKTKDEGQNREHFHDLLNAIRKASSASKKVAHLVKEKMKGEFVNAWLGMVTQAADLEVVDAASAFGGFFAVKEEAEVELCKRAAILTNKVMKHGFVSEMEDVLDSGKKITHEQLAAGIEDTINDAPNKLQLKIAQDAIDVCFSPIVQSGGKYDIKISAQSNSDKLSSDVIICSLGARYKGYCANVSRTYMVDVPPKIEKTYSTLLAVFNHCLEKMVPGNSLKDVIMSARSFLTKKDSTLVPYLSKTLGFCMGLEFRDNTLVLNEKSEAKFADGMIFTLSVGLAAVPLEADEKKGAQGDSAKLSTFSLLVADTVRVQRDGSADVLTKCAKEFADVSYNIGGDDDDKMDDDEEEDKKKPDANLSVGRAKRNADVKQAAEQSSAQRQQQQAGMSFHVNFSMPVNGRIYRNDKS